MGRQEIPPSVSICRRLYYAASYLLLSPGFCVS
jgi:hypothetical protein